MTEPVTDAYWLRQVAQGNQAAFRHLLDAHLPKAYAIAYRLLHNREDAEEAVQDAFSKVWTHAAQYEAGKSAFSTWLYTILTRRCLDRLRQRKRPNDPIDARIDTVADDSPDQATQLETAQTAAALRRAVATLPEKQKLAIVLCYFEGVSNAQAALIMGLNIKAVEGLLFRARQSLKSILRIDL